jgi:glycosyltransferase involved in cell wall biosynthesis
MHIVILSDRLPPEHAGGAEQAAWRLAGGLQKAGHRLSLITTTSGPSRNETYEGLSVYRLHSRYPERWAAWYGLANPQVLPALRRLLASLRPDVINAHNVHHHLSWASLRTTRHLGIPAVFTAHDVMSFAYGKLRHFISPSLNPKAPLTAEQLRLPFGYNARQMRLRYNPARNPIIRAILAGCNARLAVSKSLQLALAANKLPPFSVVYSGVESAPAVPAALQTQLQADLGLAGRAVLLFGGRLTDDKGSPQLLEAIRLARAEVPNLLLLVLSASKFNTPSDLSDHIRLGGWHQGDSLTALMALAQATVAASVCFETASMMALESMAVGTPAVVSAFGGGREIVADGETGYVINPYDTATYAARLVSLLTDSALRARMGAASALRAAQHFSLAGQVGQMEACFAEAVAGTD